MIRDRALGPAEPAPAEFAGPGLSVRVKRLFHATRPKFFPASVLPVLVGTTWGACIAGELDIPLFLLALVATVCVHAAANVLNDVGDDLSGTDRMNVERIFPYTGGSRFIQNGIMDVRAMATWGTILLVAAALTGLVIAYLRGPLVIAFGIAGAALGTLYSLPRIQLAARGVGEIAVAVAFGVLPVTGASWLQSGILDFPALIVSIPVSLWVAAILLMNEVPDVAADSAVGKRTLAVRLGTGGTRRLYVALQVLAVLAFLGAGALGIVPWWAAIASLAFLPIALRAARGIVSPERDRLKASIEATLALHTIGCAALIVAILLGLL